MAHSGPVYLPPNGSTNKYVKLYVDWTAATENANIISGLSGEALATSMGKIAKWYTDFKTLVFTDLSISNGTTETGKAITALSYNTSTGVISVTKGTFLTQHPTIPTSTDTTSTASPDHGDTFTTIDTITRDTNGHVKTLNTKTVTLPSQYVHPTYTAYTGKPTANQTPAFGATFTISQVKSDATGHVTSMTDRTVKIPALTYTATVTSSTTDAYQIGTLNIGGTDNIIYGKNTVYTHPTYTRSNTTSSASPAHGGTFTVIDSITSNTLGHVTAVNTKTVTLPDVPQQDTVYVTADNISDGSYFSVPFFLQTTPSTGYKSLVANGAFKGYAKDGTANVEGASYLILGNATKLSSASNKTGVLRLYSAGDKYINIRPLGGEDTITNNRTIYLPNENGTVSLIPNGKYSFFYDSNSDFASYSWHKFAEITVTEAYADMSITFLVSKTWTTVTRDAGLLTAHIRTNGTKVFSSCHFDWHWANSGIDPSNFVFVYTNTANTSCKVELWCKQTVQHDGWIFRVLKEHSRLGSADAWTLYKISGHGSASYTAGTGTYTSIKIPLASQVAITNGSAYIKSRDVANVYANPDAGTTSSLFYTAAFVKTNSGGWSIGTLPSNDKLYFLWTTDENYNNNNNSYTTWTIDSTGLFTGTATYANGGKHVLTDPNSEVYYGLTIHATAGTEENKYFRTNNGLRALTRIGTTSQRGYGFVVLGNATASGTDGNKYGGVRIYTSGTKYVQISGTNDNYLSFSSSTVTAGDGIIPVTNATYDLGTSTNLWRKVCCSTGVFLRDKTNTVYGGVCDNGANLWIGATETAATHHVGGTFISSGYDSSTSEGNPTIKISVPNATNTNATNYSVYHTGLGVGKEGFISFPNDGQYTASADNITGALVITCPFGMTNIMMSFTVDIYNYVDNECVSYRISGYNYSTGPKWDKCSASSFGDGTKANLTVRFGYNGTKAQIQIGETNTAWRWPQVRIRDILLGHQNATDRTFMSNRTGWTITFVTTNVSNVTKTITDTQIYSLSDHTHSDYLGASKASTSYYGMTDPDGTDTNWIRTTTQGIIPYQSGNAGSGHQQLGTSTWYFSAAYIDTVHGSLSGNASTATTLKTARTISLGNDFDGSASFDGSSNITISANFYRVNANGNGKTNYPWHRFGYIENKPSTTNSDTDAIFLIVSKYNGGNFGILKASFRINAPSGTNPATCNGSVRWLVRSGYAEDDACIAWRGVVSGETIYADLFLKCLAWPRTTIYQMSGNRGWTLVYSNETSDTTATDKKTSVEVYSTIETAATEIHNKTYSSISYSVQYGNVSTSKKMIDGTGTALSVGLTTQPIYFSDGIPTATTYALNKTVPSDAVFTDKYLLQSVTTTTNYRPLVLGTKSTNDTTLLDETVTGQGYITQKIYAQPSSGALYAHQYTAVGTSPGIWFNQTTTDAAYSGGTYIKAFPGNTAGTNLVIRSGGNVFVGGGESPSNLYERVITTDTNPYGTASFKGNEVLFLTADSSIYFVTGANGLSNTTYTEGTNLQTVVLNNNKHFYPLVDNSGSIGIGSNYWNNGYINNIYGTNLGSSDSHFTTAYIDTMNGKATNIGGTVTNSTSEVTQSIIFVNSTASGSHVPRLNDGIQYIYKQGTASVTGYSYLKLGNATSGGTAGNKYGCLRIYDTGTKYKNLRCEGAMTNSGQNVYLPDKSEACTLATTDDIPAAGSWTTLAGSSWTGKSSISQADSTMYYINFRNGFVEICGKVKIGNSGVASVRITTIAAAYRPSNIMRFGSVYTSGNVILTGASISITTAGVIDLVGTSPSTFSANSTYYFYLRFVK